MSDPTYEKLGNKETTYRLDFNSDHGATYKTAYFISIAARMLYLTDEGADYSCSKAIKKKNPKNLDLVRWKFFQAWAEKHPEHMAERPKCDTPSMGL